MCVDGRLTGYKQPVMSNSGEPYLYTSKAKEFVKLHDEVQTSVNLLDSLESFLSTFQKDLAAVSGQISDLQDRSKDIDGRLRSRRKIEKPLSNLLSDITIPPPLASLILDTNVGEPWVAAIQAFERHLEMTKVRSRVKAARDLTEVAEGLRIVAATKLRVFFLSLFQPIRTSVTTNMQVLQTSVLAKYQSLFSFLRRQAPSVAQEIQRAYVSAARMYYETGFRRYARSLDYIKARNPQKFEPFASGEQETSMDGDRLSNSSIEGPNVTLAYMADDKTHKAPAEALLRSLLIVFMDNATAEYTFIKSFFTIDGLSSSHDSLNSMFSPQALLSPEERQSVSGSDYGGRSRSNSLNVPPSPSTANLSNDKEEHQAWDAIWKQVLDPVMEYVQKFAKGTVDPSPPIISLLTMIRLTEAVVKEVETRGCPPGVSFLFSSVALQMWPVFQKSMTEHIESLKKLAAGGSTGYFGRSTSLSETTVQTVCNRYITMFCSFVLLTVQEEETIIFANLLRLRQELLKLVQRYSGRGSSDPVAIATQQSTVYSAVLQGLSSATLTAAHPKFQQEVAFWGKLDEEARRKIVSANQQPH